MKVVDRIDRNYKKEKLFVNNASHEINNPLTAIQGECDIALMRDRTPEEYRSFLYKISLETTRVIDIMHSLLQLSHTSSETIDQEMFECVDVGELIEHFASDEVLVNIEEDFQLMTQESLLTIALQNLINNAVKYSSGKPIHITVCRGKVEIKDYGIGISPDDLPHVFEPFYRASNAMNASGHGIGLALSKEIISKLGGKLSVSSKVDEGTCFEVIF